MADLSASLLGVGLDKSTRDQMVKKDWTWYQDNRDQIVAYCASDVWASSKVAQQLWILCCERFHPITIEAALILSTSKLPISPGFKDYIARVDRAYADVLSRISAVLIDAFERSYSSYVLPWVKGEIAIEDMPLGYQHLDWEPAKSGATKGLPAWYRKSKSANLTLDQKIAPLLLGIRYGGREVAYVKTGKNSQWFAGDDPIPHPGGEERLGGFFNKHSWALFDAGIITSDYPEALEILRKLAKVQFWKAFQGRIKEAQRFTLNGFNIPNYEYWGTATGRGKDSLWLVSPKPDPEVPGSELRSLVQPPEGWSIVGADISSQEMRIFALLGDSAVGQVAGSPLAKEVYFGDVHTALADRSGAKRSVCKPINYGAVYGLGLESATNYCRLAGMQNPGALAKGILESLKGRRVPNSNYYEGGLGSTCFNAVTLAISRPESIATSFLGNPITEALRCDDFLPSRQNWVIQAAGADMRDLIVVKVNELASHLDHQLMLFVHDEPRYLVRDEHARVFASILQEVHYWVYCEMFEALGLPIEEMPKPLQYFDAIEIDTCWRKTADDPCLTPTQLNPIPSGITITREVQNA